MVLNITGKEELEREKSKGYRKLYVKAKQQEDTDIEFNEEGITVNGKAPAEELDSKDVMFIDSKIGFFGDTKQPLNAKIRVIFCDNEMLVELVEGACLVDDSIMPEHMRKGKMLIYKKIDSAELPVLEEYTDKKGRVVTNEKWLTMSQLKEICSMWVKYGKYVSDYMFEMTITCSGNSSISYKKSEIYDISNGVFAQMEYDEELRKERLKKKEESEAFLNSMASFARQETSLESAETEEEGYEEDDDDDDDSWLYS